MLSYTHNNLILRQHSAGIGIWDLRLQVWHTLPFSQSVTEAHAVLRQVRQSITAGQASTFDEATTRQLRRSRR